MTAGEKGTSDISPRLRRPLRSATRSSRTAAGSAISAPPQAAVASEKKKAHLHRRKNPFDEMIRRKDSEDNFSSGFSSLEDLVDVQELGRNKSAEAMGGGNADARIAELERTLASVRKEREALQKELESTRRTNKDGHISRQGLEDSRRSTQSSHSFSPPRRRPVSPLPSSVQPDYNMDSSPRRSSTKVREGAIEQNLELRAKMAQLHDQLAEQDVVFRTRLEQRMHNRDMEWNELTDRLHHTEKESQERLQQLLDLKHSISALTRMDSQVTDSELTERADQLYHRIQQFVISNFRRTKLNFINLPPDEALSLEAIYPHYESLSPSDRLPFYQAIITNSLMSLFDEEVCVGPPTSGPLSAMRELAVYIHDAGTEFREWRRVTIKALEKSEAHHALQQEKEMFLHRIAASIERQLYSLTSTELTLSARSSLFAILQTAADLQHMLLLQKAQYRLHFFHYRDGGGVDFDEEKMESVNDIDEMDEDGDTVAYRRFHFCVYPCLEKFGDEFGENAEVRNVLLRARVCSGVG